MEQTSYFRVKFFQISLKTFRLHQITPNNFNNQPTLSNIFQVSTCTAGTCLLKMALKRSGDLFNFSRVLIERLKDVVHLIKFLQYGTWRFWFWWFISATQNLCRCCSQNPWKFHENLENNSISKHVVIWKIYL